MKIFKIAETRRDILILLISMLILFFIFPIGGKIDLALIQPWISSSGEFIYRQNIYLVKWNHELFKYTMIAIYIGFLIVYVCSFKFEKLKALRFQCGYAFLMIALSTAIIGLIKATSAHACPWNMIDKSSSNWAWDFSATQGHCFPGGHASSGFALISAYFVFRLSHKKVAYTCLIAGLIIGLMMGWGQMMRGAHFLSHNLWTAWIIYAFNAFGFLFFYKKLKK